MTLNQVPESEETERTIAYLQVRNIDIGNTEILFKQFVHLKDYLEKNNANQNSEATMKLSMEEKWLEFFAYTNCRLFQSKAFTLNSLAPAIFLTVRKITRDQQLLGKGCDRSDVSRVRPVEQLLRWLRQFLNLESDKQKKKRSTCGVLELFHSLERSEQ
ncbi:hypothetical protein AVEN_54509-1 [Araneus ventricosus]|uniref:Uncharacterized protein n=1 Tax=Araneus ventricosus TaxID=182803 RepID=A0A4Y2EKA0_ARAVE|nr:hypothetical protein AVEN_54509-1 [Araneus ventricosus]